MLSEIKITGIEEQIKWYSVFGGMPKYYVISQEQGLCGKEIFSALKILLLRDFAPLREEAKSILSEEFGSEHQSYFSILEAVALGNSEMTTIANKSGINIKSISKYLGLLVKDFGYLDYEVPVTEDKPWKSKRGRYFLGDNFFRFWFRFIYRNRSDYEIGNYESILNKIKQDFSSITGREFEKISMEFLSEINRIDKLPFHFSKIGRWWQRDQEIDIIAMNEDSGEILFCECKWQNMKRKAAEDILDDLKLKSIDVGWNTKKRKEYFSLIAKEIENKDGLREKGYLAFDLRDFKSVIGGHKKT